MFKHAAESSSFITVASAIEGENENEMYGCRRREDFRKSPTKVMDEYVDVMGHGPSQKKHFKKWFGSCTRDLCSHGAKS